VGSRMGASVVEEPGTDDGDLSPVVVVVAEESMVVDVDSAGPTPSLPAAWPSPTRERSSAPRSAAMVVKAFEKGMAPSSQ